MHTQFLFPDAPVKLANQDREEPRCLTIEILVLEGNMERRKEAFTKVLSEQMIQGCVLCKSFKAMAAD